MNLKDVKNDIYEKKMLMSKFCFKQIMYNRKFHRDVID